MYVCLWFFCFALHHKDTLQDFIHSQCTAWLSHWFFVAYFRADQLQLRISTFFINADKMKPWMGSNHCAMCVRSSLFLCSFAIPFLLDLKKCTNYVVNLRYGHFGWDVDKRNAGSERERKKSSHLNSVEYSWKFEFSFYGFFWLQFFSFVLSPSLLLFLCLTCLIFNFKQLYQLPIVQIQCEMCCFFILLPFDKRRDCSHDPNKLFKTPNELLSRHCLP